MAAIRRLITYKEQSSFYDAATEKDVNYVGRQIHTARKDLKISLEQFSQLLAQYGVEITRTALNKWELGKAVPSAYQLLAVCAALHLEDGFDYFVRNTKRPLLNAEGRRKVKEYREDLIASGKYREVPPVLEIRYRDMPVSDLPVSAGTGAFLDEGNFEMVSFPESSIPDGAEFGVRVSGDSMEPVYHDGQIVWVQQCETLRTGDVGVMIYDGQGYIKAYAEQEPDDLETYLCSDGVRRMQPVMVSYNKAYAPKPASPELEFRIVGRVL